MTAETAILMIPLSELVLSPLNARTKPHTAAEIEELAALIEAQGLLQNLNVIEQLSAPRKKGGEPKPTGLKEVVAGGGRLKALQLLVEKGKLDPHAPIPCKLSKREIAIDVSVTENSGRKPMHPSEEFVAFREMQARDAATVEDIASRFGVSPFVVRQRLKLARVAPEFIEMYRNDEIQLSALEALALSDDQEEQRRVWKTLSKHNRYPHMIRQALTHGEVNASCAKARFVGLKAYEKAGGQIRRDLFADGQSYLCDSALLERLVSEKLNGIAAKEEKKGVAWVDVHAEEDHGQIMNQYKDVTSRRRTPSADQQAKIDALASEYETLEDEYHGTPESSDERYDEIRDRMEAIEEEQQEIEAALKEDDPNQLELAGTVICLGSNGKVETHTRQLRNSDAKMFEQVVRKARGNADDVDGESIVTTAHSDAMIRRLTSHRTAGLQVELMRRPDIALVALTAQLASDMLSTPSWAHFEDDVTVELDGVGMHIRATATSHTQHAADLESSPAIQALQAERRAIIQLLSDAQIQEGNLFGWLLNQPTEVVMRLMAFCSASCVDALQFTHSSAQPASAGVIEAVALDMRQWWKPTAEAYFNAMPKARIIDAAAAITGKPDDGTLAKMKKGELAAQAEVLAGEHGWQWIPGPLRGVAD
jgi:ParB family chromosome partitioning protein